MSFIVDMDKWRSATCSVYYKDWDDNAKAVLNEANCLPTREHDDRYQTWEYAVCNPNAKRKNWAILQIVLTKNGELEYREPLLKQKARQWWFVQEVAKKTALLCGAFANNGFLLEREAKEGDA